MVEPIGMGDAALCCLRKRAPAHRGDHRDIKSDDLGRELGQSTKLAMSPTIVNPDVLPFSKASCTSPPMW